MGLMGVVSLPRAFVFRVSLDDPHPIPWIRVKLSCAMGAELYPHPQWTQLSTIWESFYPRDRLDAQRQELFSSLEAGMPAFVSLLIEHRPPRLHGRSLGEALCRPDRQPERLQAHFQRWRRSPVERMSRAAPAMAFAMIGQARADGILSAESESRLLTELLTRWAVRSAIDASSLSAGRANRAGPAPGIWAPGDRKGLRFAPQAIQSIKDDFTSN
jgi:hypothetical protein